MKLAVLSREPSPDSSKLLPIVLSVRADEVDHHYPCVVRNNGTQSVFVATDLEHDTFAVQHSGCWVPGDKLRWRRKAFRFQVANQLGYILPNLVMVLQKVFDRLLADYVHLQPYPVLCGKHLALCAPFMGA